MAPMRIGIVIPGAVVGALLFLPTNAHADPELARQRFEIGKKLRDEGDCAHAVIEFDRSLAADKSIGAYYNMGYCQEQLGRRQDAYDAYKHAQQLASAKHDERLREIGGALVALLDTPHIRLVLPQPLPAGIQVTVDEQVVPETLYATETVVFTKDTKDHVVRVTAPGYEERRESMETKDLRAIDLRRTEMTIPVLPVKDAPANKGGWTSQHWLGLGLAAGGVVGGAVVSVLTLDHRSNVDDIQATYEKTRDACPKSAGAPAQSCETTARGRRNDEMSSENTRIAITGGLVGAVSLALLVSGGVIFFNAVRHPPNPLGPSWTPSSVAGLRPLRFSASQRATSSETAGARLRVVPNVGPSTHGLSLVGAF